MHIYLVKHLNNCTPKSITMKDFESRSYLLQFTCYGTDYVVPVSEVPLARGATAYVIKMHYYQGLFVETNNHWTIKSRGIISESLKQHIIKEIKFQQHQFNFMVNSSMCMRAIL